MTEIEKKQEFWKGAVRGVIASAVFFVCLVTVIYCIVSLITVVGR